MRSRSTSWPINDDGTRVEPPICAPVGPGGTTARAAPNDRYGLMVSAVDGSMVGCQTGRVSLPHALLGLLARRPASGYDLREAFDTSLAFVWLATHSQLYRELSRLAGGGLVEAGPPGPREYTVTAAGRRELIRWLTESEPVPAQRSPTLLRAFFLWNLPADTARAYFQRVSARSHAFHERLDGLAAAARL